LAGRRLDELACALGGRSLASTLRNSLRAARVGDQRHRPAPTQLAPEEITLAAADRHLRDLRLTVAAAAPRARVIFVLQPFLDPARRELHPDERELVAPMDARQWWSAAVAFAEQHWASYKEKLQAGCERIGVPFGMLEAVEFAGWSFVDRVHMTDHGQHQAATKILEMMGRAVA
jgi:hypothetical protein